MKMSHTNAPNVATQSRREGLSFEYTAPENVTKYEVINQLHISSG